VFLPPKKGIGGQASGGHYIGRLHHNVAGSSQPLQELNRNQEQKLNRRTQSARRNGGRSRRRLRLGLFVSAVFGADFLYFLGDLRVLLFNTFPGLQ